MNNLDKVKDFAEKLISFESPKRRMHKVIC